MEPGRYEVTLSSSSVSLLGNVQAGDIWLRAEADIPELGLSLAQFHREFMEGRIDGISDGLVFGRWLHARLFEEAPRLRGLWERIRGEQGTRPLRLELVLPHQMDGSGLPVEDLPFELLADVEGPFFRRHGWTLVRCYDRHTARDFEVQRGSRALLAWANPELAGLGRLDGEMFSRHEETFLRHGRVLELEVTEPLREATYERFKAALSTATPILSLVAHGASGGGAIVLHAPGDVRLPAPVQARDFARACRDGNVQVALLWSCHGAQRHPLGGAVVEALLNPEWGNLAAVVSAHAPLRAIDTPRLADTLLGAFSGTERDLERAVARSRTSLGEDDLQWAVPVYYARPLEGRTVVRADEPALQPQLSIAMGGVEKGPERPAWFVGREVQVVDGLELLRRHRLVSVVGMPGIGKSEVVREIAERAAADTTFGFTRALWFAADEVELEVLRTMIGLRFSPDFDPSRCTTDLQLARILKDAHLLLVFDNAEDYLVSAGSTRTFVSLLSMLLGECPHVQVLLGSRRALGNFGRHVEHLVKVPLLPRAEARTLFLCAAGLPLSETSEATDVEAIIDLLDGHPRSLMLIAGQMGRGLSAAGIRARLEAERVEDVVVYELLGEDVPASDDRVERTRRLVSSLNLAYAHLKERRPLSAEMFAWLGALPAGIPRELLEPIFGEDAAIHLGALLREHMVDDPDPRRITLPAPLRWYAARKLEEQPPARSQELLGRTLDAFAKWHGAGEAAIGTPRAPAAIKRALTEGSNVSALSRRFDGHEARLAYGRLVTSWAEVLHYAGAVNVALLEVKNARERLNGIQDEALANTLEAQGDLYVRTARLKEGEQAYTQALGLYRLVEDQLGEANTLRALGELCVRTDRLKEGEEAYTQALGLYRQVDGRLGEANTLKAQGDLYVRTARLKKGEEAYTQALGLYRQVEERPGEANTLRALGELYVRTARLNEAEEAYTQALGLYRQVEERLGEANTLRAQGDLDVRTARLKEAEEAYTQALGLYRRVEDRFGEANTLRAMGDLYVRLGRLKEGEEAYTQALGLYREVEDQLGEANTLRALGVLYVRTARLKAAEEVYSQALGLYREVEERLGEANTLRALGELCVRTDRLKEGEEAYNQALGLHREVEDQLGEANTLKAQGDLYVRTDRLKEGEEAYTQALRLCQQLEDQLGEANTLNSLGLLEQVRRSTTQAYRYHLQALSIVRQVHSRLAEAGTSRYLGRTALLASRPDLGMLWTGRALGILVSIEDNFGQMLVLTDLAQSAAGLEHYQVATLALLLAWERSVAISDPSSTARAEHLANILPDFNPQNRLLKECAEFLGIIQSALKTHEKFLLDQGINPEEPLD
jgi:tetratricopeptide (TPR) repeat protein